MKAMPQAVAVRDFTLGIGFKQKNQSHRKKKSRRPPEAPECAEWSDEEIGKAINGRFLGYCMDDIARDVDCTVRELNGLFQKIRKALEKHSERFRKDDPGEESSGAE